MLGRAMWLLLQSLLFSSLCLILSPFFSSIFYTFLCLYAHQFSLLRSRSFSYLIFFSHIAPSVVLSCLNFQFGSLSCLVLYYVSISFLVSYSHQTLCLFFSSLMYSLYLFSHTFFQMQSTIKGEISITLGASLANVSQLFQDVVARVKKEHQI